MPLKPHPTDPDKMVYASRQYDMPDTPTARAYLAKVLDDDDTQVYKDHGDALTAAYMSGYHDGKKAAISSLEQNFCSRCGKRTKDIHTCTPLQEKNG